jgi:uncharacterized protein (TIGR00730 family)
MDNGREKAGQIMKRIAVFCGSSSGNKTEYLTEAKRLGQLLVQNKIGLVYGGAHVGLMGAIANSVLEACGEVTGVIPENLVKREVAHKGLTELHVVNSMHERKALMAELADGFIAMPGGFGTFEEFCEIVTWTQLGLHQKPAGLLNVNSYYDPILQLFDHGVRDGFISEQHRTIVLESSNPAELLRLMKNYKPAALKQWIKDDSQT